MDEPGVGVQGPRTTIPVRDLLLHPAALIIIGELQAQAVGGRDVGDVCHRHGEEAVLAIPLVGPDAVEAQIPVSIVGQRLGIGREAEAPFVRGAGAGGGYILP